MAPVTPEENYKLLAAYCVANGDQEIVAKYMGITKNAVYDSITLLARISSDRDFSAKRYAKLIATEKEAMEKAGLIGGGGGGKKRAAADTGGTKTAKKAKKGQTQEENDADEDSGVKVKDENGDGNAASDEAEAGSDEA